MNSHDQMPGRKADNPGAGSVETTRPYRVWGNDSNPGGHRPNDGQAPGSVILLADPQTGKALGTAHLNPKTGVVEVDQPRDMETFRKPSQPATTPRANTDNIEPREDAEQDGHEAASNVAAPARILEFAPARDGLGYAYDYSLGIPWPRSELESAESIMASVARHFNYYFPFSSDCPQLPEVGGVCRLYTFGATFEGYNPVQVVDRTETSFTFLALPGHAEGAGRHITFSFYKVTTVPGGDLRMYVVAGGPWTVAAWATIESGVAHALWAQFAWNIGSLAPAPV